METKIKVFQKNYIVILIDTKFKNIITNGRGQDKDVKRLSEAKYYHSETEFWSPLTSGIYILRTRINAYEFPPLICQDMSDRLSEPNCKEILELQQVELGRVARDLTENNAKIEAALQAAIKKGKRFSIQTADMREATDKEWEKAEQIIEKFQLFNVPCVSVRTAKTKEDLVIDEFD